MKEYKQAELKIYNMIDLKDAWKLIFVRAIEAWKKQEEIESIRNGVNYKIQNVTAEEIVIQLNGENQFLRPRSLRSQIQKLNLAGGTLSYHLFFGNVAKETITVRFHPQLDWDSNGQYIIDIKS